MKKNRFLPHGTPEVIQGTQRFSKGIIKILPQENIMKPSNRYCEVRSNFISFAKGCFLLRNDAKIVVKTKAKNSLTTAHLNLGVLCGKPFILFFLLFMFSCNTKKQEAAQKEVVSNKYYTCSMHPQIMERQPGKCPICGMQLIVIEKTATANEGEIKLTNQQILLGNIHTDTIRNGSVGDELTLTGTLNFNQNKATSYSSRVAGRVDKLYFKAMGDYINKGDKLFDIYSEDLNSAKQEYLAAKDQKAKLGKDYPNGVNYESLIQSAKNKLLLWGMSEAQIGELNKNNLKTTTFYSKSSGYVTALDIKEGDYLMEGGTIVKLANLDDLWVDAQVYTSQLSFINHDANAFVQVVDMPEKVLKGSIEFINPEILTDTRINLVRISIPNQGHQLKPGMPAYVFIKNPKHHSLTLPTDAVLRGANGAVVWVQTGINTYKSKMVETGLETDGSVEIKSGLAEGEVVVTSGAYLINSEYIFKNGSDPMAGMKM